MKKPLNTGANHVQSNISFMNLSTVSTSLMQLTLFLSTELHFLLG